MRDPLKPRITLTKNIPKPNPYVLAINAEYKGFAFDEESALANKGQWRTQVFQCDKSTALDLEIGTGNGNHFAHHALSNPGRCLVGLELKFKPLIQSIRRVLNGGGKNARICRFHAHDLALLFNPGEINNVYIHFPDPWVKPKKYKNRIVSRDFLKKIFDLQTSGSFIEFKTDSRDYFLWALEEIKDSPYFLDYSTLDLHQSEKASENFITTFEKIFLKQNVPINYALLRRP